MNPAEGKMTDDDHLFDDAPQGVAPVHRGAKRCRGCCLRSPSRKRR